MRLIFKKKPILVPRSCPFCGGKPKLSRCGDHRDLWYIRCSECYETPLDWGEAKVNIDDAIKIYNTRAAFAERIITTYQRVETSINKKV